MLRLSFITHQIPLIGLLSSLTLPPGDKCQLFGSRCSILSTNESDLSAVLNSPPQKYARHNAGSTLTPSSVFFQTTLLKRSIMVHLPVRGCFDETPLNFECSSSLLLLSEESQSVQQWGKWPSGTSAGREQDTQALIESNTTCPKEIISCKSTGRLTCPLSKAKSMGDHKHPDCSGPQEALAAAKEVGSTRLIDNWQKWSVKLT